MTVTVKVPKYSDLLKSIGDATVERVLIEIENTAKLTAPVDTGFYRNNIKRVIASSEVVANAVYSSAIEYGVSGTLRTPMPVMRNAARTVQAEVGNIFLRELDKRV